MFVHKYCLFPQLFLSSNPVLQLFQVKSSVLCCSSLCFTGKKKEKRHLKSADLPVLDRRLPVASRYSNGLAKSGARLNAFTRLSVFRLISAFSALFSKTNLTDCSQVSSLSYDLKGRDLKLKVDMKGSN